MLAGKSSEIQVSERWCRGFRKHPQYGNPIYVCCLGLSYAVIWLRPLGKINHIHFSKFACLWQVLLHMLVCHVQSFTYRPSRGFDRPSYRMHCIFDCLLHMESLVKFKMYPKSTPQYGNPISCCLGLFYGIRVNRRLGHGPSSSLPPFGTEFPRRGTGDSRETCGRGQREALNGSRLLSAKPC